MPTIPTLPDLGLLTAPRERVLVLGAGALARRLIEVIEVPGSGWMIAGVVADSWPDDQPSPFPLMGSTADLESILRRTRPDRIVVALWDRRGRLPVEMLLQSKIHGIKVEDGVAVYERLTGKLAIEALWPSSLLFSGDLRPGRGAALLARIIGILVSIAGLAITLPLLPLIALAIRLESPGPIFFVQERVGLFGRRFGLIKFRTMRQDGRNGSEWIRDNAGRVTRIGRWLRRLHLDELPQFVNILRGDMNLVGPRPHPASNFELFSARIPYYALRAAVRPGLTGWAQIRYGYANTLDEETEKMRYDLYYVKHRSLWMDLGILARTARLILAGRGTEAMGAEDRSGSLRIGVADRAA